MPESGTPGSVGGASRKGLVYPTCIGITRGGRNTKIHAVVDALGNPIHVQLSSGNIHDATIAEEVLDHVDLNETTVMADPTYGTYDLREYIANRNADFCIQPKSNSIDPW